MKIFDNDVQIRLYSQIHLPFTEAIDMSYQYITRWKQIQQYKPELNV